MRQHALTGLPRHISFGFGLSRISPLSLQILQLKGEGKGIALYLSTLPIQIMPMSRRVKISRGCAVSDTGFHPLGILFVFF